MTAIGVYRPLSCAVGRRSATGIAFLASGVLHELAISAPVLDGFGLPLLYFLLHGLLVLVESWLERRGLAVHQVAWFGRTWTIAWIVLPLGILFHPPFLRGVVWPALGL